MLTSRGSATTVGGVTVDVRRWAFEGEGDAQAQLRPGRTLVLRAVPDGPGAAATSGPALAVDGDLLGWDSGDPDGPGLEPAAVVVHRAGSSLDAVRHGERVGLLVDPAPGGPGAPGGYLVAGPPGAGPVLAPAGRDRDEPWWAQWEITGEVPGAGVVAGRPVGLFNLVQGDHLVLAGDGRTAPALGWWSQGDPGGALPVPPLLRPPDAAPGEVELHGTYVPAGPGTALLLLDPPLGRLLGGHLAARVPDVAAGLVPDAVAPSVAVRLPAPLDPALRPEPGSRIWVRGRLVAGPARDGSDRVLTVVDVRGAARATTADGTTVLAAPGEVGWPDDVVVWRLLTWPATDVRGPVVWALPLPARDGEPGSSTTFTRRREPVAAGVRGPGDRGRRPTPPHGTPTSGAVPPSIVRDVRSGRRALRFLGLPPAGEGPVVDGVTVRVHLRTEG